MTWMNFKKHYAKWKEPKITVLCNDLLYEVSKQGKFLETENRLVTAKSWNRDEP